MSKGPGWGGTIPDVCDARSKREESGVGTQVGLLSQVLEWGWGGDLTCAPPFPGVGTVAPGAPGHSGVGGGGVETTPGFSHHNGAEPAEDARGGAGGGGPAEAGQRLRGAGPGGCDQAVGEVGPSVPGARGGVRRPRSCSFLSQFLLPCPSLVSA